MTKNNLEFLGELSALIQQKKNDDPKKSYTASLFEEGTTKIAQKVGEEAVEVVIAAIAEDREHLIYETGDLIFHLLVLLEKKNISLDEVISELIRRNKNR